MDNQYDSPINEESNSWWSNMSCWKKTLAIIGFFFLGLIILFIFIWNGLKVTLHVTSDVYSDLADPASLGLPDVNKKLKIMAYNIYMLPKLLHPFTETYLEDRSKEFLKILEGFDIVLLEESFMFGSSIISDFAKMARIQYNYIYMKTSRRPKYFSRFVIDSGLILFSKYPIIDSDDITYKTAINFDTFAAKGVLYAKIQISSKKHIHIFGTHTQASYANDTDPYSVSARRSQFEQVRELMMKKLTDGMPGILMGDLNVNSRTWEYDKMMSEYLSIPGYRINDLIDKKVPLDYILLFTSDRSYDIKGAGSFDYHKIEGKPYKKLSDHPSVMADIEIPAL